MRFIRGAVIALTSLFVGSAQAQSVTIGTDFRAFVRRQRQRQSSGGPKRHALPGRNRPEPVLLRHRRPRKTDPRHL